MNKKLYESEFKDKNITVMGLGILGRGLKVTQFLAGCGGKITVTDLKNEEALSVSLKALSKFPIHYVLGRHELKDFENADMIIKAPGIPLDSVYIKHAKKHGIPIIMDASIFSRIIRKTAPQTTIIGITGTRGKSMTTALIYHILKINEKKLGCTIHLGGNMRMKATLPLLAVIKDGDIVVLELDSWQCQGLGDEHISPHIAVFTSLMPDHMNYYKNSMKKYIEDKCKIFKYQTPGNVLVTDKKTLAMLPIKPRGKLIIGSTKNVQGTHMKIFGDHNVKNASYAFAVAKSIGLSDIIIKKSLETFSGLEGRLQHLCTVRGIHVINDNNATTPEATSAGLKAVSSAYGKSNITLIVGGTHKNLEIKSLVSDIKKYTHAVILLPGTGTELLKKSLKVSYTESVTLADAVERAFKTSKKGDLILFSPGFTSFGLFLHEYDRNDQFVKIIQKLQNE